MQRNAEERPIRLVPDYCSRPGACLILLRGVGGMRHNMLYAMPDPLPRFTYVQPILDWLLHKGVDLSQTSFGNVQLMSWTAGYLEIKAQRGFDDAFLRFFERVRIEDGSACARALQNREAIVIEDIMVDEAFSPCREAVSNAGVRAVQSTPIISSSGALLGVMSTHLWRATGRQRSSCESCNTLRKLQQMPSSVSKRMCTLRQSRSTNRLARRYCTQTDCSSRAESFCGTCSRLSGTAPE